MTATLKAGNVYHNFREMAPLANLHEHQRISEQQFQERDARGTAREHHAMGGQMYDQGAERTADKILKGSVLENAELEPMER